MEHQTLEQSLRSGALDGRLAAVYGAEGLEKAKERCAAAAAGFTKTFESTPEAFFSAPGRTELGGNHTRPPARPGPGRRRGPGYPGRRHPPTRAA